jgi:hypothetical protein
MAFSASELSTSVDENLDQQRWRTAPGDLRSDPSNRNLFRGYDLDNHFDEAFHDDLEDLDEVIAQNIGSTFGGFTVTE